MMNLSQVDLLNLFLIGIPFGVCTAFVIWSIRRELEETAQVIEHHAEILHGEIAERRAFLEELAVRSLNLAEPQEFVDTRREIDELQKEIAVERGRIEVVERDVERVKAKLAEIAEIDRALQINDQQNALELERLEKEVLEGEAEIATLKDRLKAVCEKEAKLLLDSKKFEDEVKPIVEQLAWFIRESAETGRRYLRLKRAYDALNIEYTQLYEKQSAAE